MAPFQRYATVPSVEYCSWTQNKKDVILSLRECMCKTLACILQQSYGTLFGMPFRSGLMAHCLACHSVAVLWHTVWHAIP